MKIPQQGMPQDELFAELEGFRRADLDGTSGRTWGYTYDAGREVADVAKRAFTSYMSANGLDPTSFPSLLRFENDLVAMGAAHLSGDSDVVGNFTSGGTESIILAVKAARDYARAKRPELGQPEMIVATTAHAAFHKAAHYLGVKIVQVPVDLETFKMDVAATRAAITANTVLIVGSAASYAHGVVDPITDLGALALEKDLLLHVDACIGGFLLPYLARLGADVAPFDFSVPGVTSISMDLHKYAYTPKGASLILYRSADVRRFQLYACANWTGYSVVNPTIQSSKSGGPLAAAWAVMNFLGDEGYLELARTVYETTRAIVRGIEGIEGLRLLTQPEMSLIAFTSEGVSPFHVVDEMKERGWYVQAQLSFQGSPASIHLTVAPANAGQEAALIEDLRASLAAAREIDAPSLADVVGPMLAGLDPASLDGAAFSGMLAMAGVTGTELPGRMAGINELMDLLPPALREALLKEFFNAMFRPSTETASEELVSCG